MGPKWWAVPFVHPSLVTDTGVLCLTEGDYRKQAYSHFITALKRHSSFAPAFTSLGIYYSEYVDPPDPARASKCFQKAVELDSREGDAARRLAEGFADEREWDLVEVVARRTIEGEGGAEDNMLAPGAGNSAAASRYKPVNAWAWKAIGVVELVRNFFIFYFLEAARKTYLPIMSRIAIISDLRSSRSRSPFVLTTMTSGPGHVLVKHMLNQDGQ